MISELQAEAMGLKQLTQWLRPKEKFPSQYERETKAEIWLTLEKQRIEKDSPQRVEIVTNEVDKRLALFTTP